MLRLSAGGIVGIRPSQPELKIEDIIKKADDDNGDVNDILIAKVITKVDKKKPKRKAFAPAKEDKITNSAEKLDEVKIDAKVEENPVQLEEMKEIIPEAKKSIPKKNLFEVEDNGNEVEEKPVEKKPVKKTTIKKSLKNLFDDD